MIFIAFLIVAILIYLAYQVFKDSKGGSTKREVKSKQISVIPAEFSFDWASHFEISLKALFDLPRTKDADNSNVFWVDLPRRELDVFDTAGIIHFSETHENKSCYRVILEGRPPFSEKLSTLVSYCVHRYGFDEMGRGNMSQQEIDRINSKKDWPGRRWMSKYFAMNLSYDNSDNTLQLVFKNPINETTIAAWKTPIAGGDSRPTKREKTMPPMIPIKGGQYDFIAIDFETATAARSSACAMAMVFVRDLEIIEKRKFLIQPPDNKYTLYNSRNIHGIYPEHTKDEQPISAYYEEIYTALHGGNVVAHSLEFDMSVLEKSLEYYGLEPPKPKAYFCTYEMTGKKLNECCWEYNIELNHHDPLSDAVACAELYMKLRDGVAPSPKSAKKPSSPSSPLAQEKLTRKALTDEDITNKETVFYGKKVVITGQFDTYGRTEIADVVQSLGASVSASVSKSTDILLRGKDCGPAKLAKAREFGIEIIDEDYLLEIL